MLKSTIVRETDFVLTEHIWNSNSLKLCHSQYSSDQPDLVKIFGDDNHINIGCSVAVAIELRDLLNEFISSLGMNKH